MLKARFLAALLPLIPTACHTPAPEHTEFTPGLRFRFQAPADEHFFEIRSIERHPRIVRFEVTAFEDRNRDSIRQPDELSTTYAQSPNRPTNFVLIKRTGDGSTWDRTVYRATVFTEDGRVVEHSWAVDG
ncbi:MAG: hypothetical protein H6834_05340 [Planctomycetes bacterium]|nr:hypothetical protein [Planctomycetota bacterium]